MEHFVAYHSARQERRILKDFDSLYFYSGKIPLLKKAIGNTVWVVQGIPDEKSTAYFLCGAYIADEVDEAEGEGEITGHQIKKFDVPVYLNNLDWFGLLKKSQANFSLGFNRINYDEVVHALSVLKPSDGSKDRWDYLTDAFDKASALPDNKNENKKASADDEGWPWETVGFELQMAQENAKESDEFDPKDAQDARKQIIKAIMQRQGQPKFRRCLRRAYQDKCAITGCNVEYVLEAAHIMPYRGAQTNHVSNGLLLRADLHALFDAGQLAIDPDDFTVILSPDLRGTEYGALHGKKLSLPKSESDRPHVDALRNHYQQSGLGEASSSDSA